MIEVDKSISWLQVSLPKGGGIKGEGLIYKGKEIGEEENKFVRYAINMSPRFRVSSWCALIEIPKPIRNDCLTVLGVRGQSP